MTKQLPEIPHGNTKVPLIDAYLLRKEGWTFQKIADKYGVSDAAVCKRLNKYFPELSIKKLTAVCDDLYNGLEFKTLKELVSRDPKKETTYQLNGTLKTINEIKSQRSDKTGDININIVNILTKHLDKYDDQRETVIDAEYSISNSERG